VRLLCHLRLTVTIHLIQFLTVMCHNGRLDALQRPSELMQTILSMMIKNLPPGDVGSMMGYMRQVAPLALLSALMAWRVISTRHSDGLAVLAQPWLAGVAPPLLCGARRLRRARCRLIQLQLRTHCFSTCVLVKWLWMGASCLMRRLNVISYPPRLAAAFLSINIV
jgi:hypothetical protein